ncbi:MAG: carboxypeptidase regulatory-like domain-containing protein [Planctomycetes bacterium]|nr:carboxypeptidase regulatory-like domain-containing protein [Planctomycetota bacterium]
MFHSILRISLAMAGFLLVGCGSSGIVSVSGTLTYKGKPVTNAFVNFVPADGGRPSMGETDAAGKFTLTYDPQTKGAKAGKHKVFVTRNAAADAANPGAIPGMPAVMSGDQQELFHKYGGDNSTVVVEIVKPEGNLELKWD